MTSSFPCACLIPALNAEDTVSDAIQSARDFSLVYVCDDGSTDNTSAIARSAGAEVFRQSHLGAPAARNALMHQAIADGFGYFAFLDADDQRLPGTLQTQLTLLGDADLLISAIVALPDNDLVLPHSNLHQLFESWCFQTNGLLMRSSIGVAWRDLPNRQELFFALDCFGAGKSIALSDYPVAICNRDSDGITKNVTPAQRSATRTLFQAELTRIFRI